MSTVNNALSTLASVNSEVALGLQVGSVVIPLIKGLISEIKSIVTPQGTVTYTVVIATDQQELVDVVNVSLADLAAINSELTRLKQPTVITPSESAQPIVIPSSSQPSQS